NVIELQLPPLRDRGDDVMLIAQALLARTGAGMNLPSLHFSPEAAEAIRRYRGPGNERELENAVERAAILCDEDEITPELLGIEHDIGQEHSTYAATALESMRGPETSRSEHAENNSQEDYFQNLELEDQEHMTETERPNKLGISRKCLWERRQRLGIPRKKTPS